jgi:hypothetical protein
VLGDVDVDVDAERVVAGGPADQIEQRENTVALAAGLNEALDHRIPVGVDEAAADPVGGDPQQAIQSLDERL